MSEKMNWSQAEAVVRAYRAEHGSASGIDVTTLARLLGADVGEVRRLAGRKPRFVDRSGVLSACLTLVSVLSIGGLYTAAHHTRHLIPLTPLASAPLQPDADIHIRWDDGEVRVSSPIDDADTRINGEVIGELFPSRDTKL